ncbi:MAG: TIGR04255 family protein, partial [Pseudomonadales bacterium]
MRYKKAPILEAVLEFRWTSKKSLDEIKAVLGLPVFEGFQAPKPRVQFETAFKPDENAISHNQRQLGFEVMLRDGSEIVFLEEQKFVFVQRAPYDRWENFSEKALAFLTPTVAALDVSEFSRVGLRFVNRIDISEPEIDTDEYLTVKFDGPRLDRGIIEEFQMRVVKPSDRK